MGVFYIRLPDGLMDRIKAGARTEERTQTAMIRLLLEEGAERRGWDLTVAKNDE